MAGNNRKRFLRQLAALALACVFVLVLVSAAGATGRIVHSVHVGSPDACESWGLQPGCDANLSLNALEYADGSVEGRLVDRFGHGYGGLKADIDCMNVEGNVAWVSGVITQGWLSIPEEDFYWDTTGLPLVFAAVDNGVSANDPPDQVTFVWVDMGVDCHSAPIDAGFMQWVQFFEMPKGQVIVR
jgi:hypothetical protein